MKRAHEVLWNTELKQAICNYILGASFKDVEKAMRSVIAERNPPDDDIVDDKPYKPLKKDDIGISDLPISKPSKYKVLSLEETMKLINASEEPCVVLPRKVSTYLGTYSQEQVEAWVKEFLEDKEKYELLRRQQNKKQEPSL